jgi:hypothetical protein
VSAPSAGHTRSEGSARAYENGLTARFLLELHRRLDGDGTTATPYADAASRALAVLGDLATVEGEGRIVGAYLMALEDATTPVIDVTVVGATPTSASLRSTCAPRRPAAPRSRAPRRSPRRRMRSSRRTCASDPRSARDCPLPLVG